MLKEITRTEAYPTGKIDEPGYAEITVYEGLTDEEWSDIIDMRPCDAAKYLNLDKPDNYLVTPGALYCESVSIISLTRTCVVVERRYNYNI